MFCPNKCLRIYSPTYKAAELIECRSAAVVVTLKLLLSPPVIFLSSDSLVNTLRLSVSACVLMKQCVLKETCPSSN